MNRDRRSFLQASVAATCSIGLAGCLGNGNGNRNGGGGGEGPIRFGVPTSLSGPNSQLGSDYLTGIEIWLEDVNERGGLLDREIELIHYDDESTPDRSRQLAERLVSEDDVDFLFGPYGSPTNYAACLVADQTQTPMVAGSGSDPDIFDRGLEYYYSLVSKTTEYGATLPQFLDSVDWDAQPIDEPTTFASVRAEAPFTQDIGQTLAGNLEDADFELVHESEYPLDISDFSSILTQIESADPDMLILSGFPADEARFAEQMQQAGLNVDFHYQYYSVQPVIVETLGEQVDYLFNGAWWDRRYEFERNEQYVEAWNERNPDRQARIPFACGTASGMALETAIENAGSTDPDEVNQELKNLETETTLGPVEFHETGWNLHQYKNEGIRQWQDQRIELLYPEEFQTSDPWFPIPEWGNRDEPPA